MLVTIDTGTIVIGMIVKEKTGRLTDGNVRAHPVAVLNMIIIAPGRHPPGGRSRRKDLQGTMITDGGLQMTVEGLIHILTAAGTNLNGVETTEDVTRRTNDMRRGLQGMRTGKAVGPVESNPGLVVNWPLNKQKGLVSVVVS